MEIQLQHERIGTSKFEIFKREIFHLYNIPKTHLIVGVHGLNYFQATIAFLSSLAIRTYNHLKKHW